MRSYLFDAKRARVEIQKMIQSTHFIGLKAAYNKVGADTWLCDDFLTSNLKRSRLLFEPQSLKSLNPRPKSVDVNALLSGLPFQENVINGLLTVQQDISEILNNTLHYWVKPQNLGIEYCVFKWPDGSWKSEWHPLIKDAISEIEQLAYILDIRGVQVNPDGCVVARGYDCNRSLFRIREHMQKTLSFLPERQSGWAHIPLGRILEPVGKRRFKKLNAYFHEKANSHITTVEIDRVHYVNETRWYMEERTTLLSRLLQKNAQ